MTSIIQNTWLPIMRTGYGGETHIGERDAIRIANKPLLEANYVKQREGKWKLGSYGFGTCSAL